MKRNSPERTAPRAEAAPLHHELVPARQSAAGDRPVSRPPPQAGDSEELLAALCYLGVIFFSFLPALVIYLSSGRRSGYLRYHAARAVNLAITLLLFGVSALIMGGLLALDTVGVALIIVLPLASALWLVALGYILRAAIATGRGQHYELPEWLRVQVLK